METELGCSRCETYICPRCLVYTPVGARCPDCAMLRRPPMYELAALDYARAAGAALVLAVVFGVIGALLLPPGGRTQFFRLFIALLGGSAAGSGMAAALDRVTRGKRGPAMQVTAVAAFGFAGAVRLFVSGAPELFTQDLAGGVALVIAAVVAWGRLR